jgi:hypothetical protein
MENNIPQQPPIKPGFTTAKTTNNPRRIALFQKGAKRSQERLKQLYYDPIEKLVNDYKEIEEEIAYQRKLRSGEIVELTPTGRVKNYRPEIHHALYDKKISIAKELLRYGYARVPEVLETMDNSPKSLIVNLTKKGETYEINKEQPQQEDDFYDDM